MPKEKEVHDIDAPHRSASNPDDFGFFNEATLGAHSKVQVLEAELAKEKALKEAYKIDYAIDETDAEITERMIHNRAVAELDHLYTEEGFEGWKQATADMLGARADTSDPQAESDALYKEGYVGRLKREAREAKEREAAE